MTEYAELDKDGNVLRVIVITPEMLAKGHWGNPTNWVLRENLPAPKKIVVVMPANGSLNGNAPL